MATQTRVNFLMDADLKEQGEKVFAKMGLNMTTALNLFVQAAVQTGELPFTVRTDEAATRARIHKALLEAQAQAADPNTVLLTEEESFGRFDTKYGL